MAAGSPEAWYFSHGLSGRQPVQFGPFPSEAACLAAITAMQPIIAPNVTSEYCFHVWRGPDLWKG